MGEKKAFRWAEYGELASLFWFQFVAQGIWWVPLSSVLAAHGLAGITAYAFAASAVAAFVSPLIFGAIADRHASPVRVLRWLAVSSAAMMAIVARSIQAEWPAGVALLLLQVFSLCAAPTTSITIAIVFSRLGESRNQFARLRIGATIGWMCGCSLIHSLNVEGSARVEYIGASVWLALAAFTFLLPEVDPPRSAGRATWKQRLGWDALVLLKNRDHCVVFTTAALFSIPLAAFYPFTPPHLQHLGFRHVTAWMTLGQTMEIVTLLAMGELLSRYRLKWIFLAALGFGVARFALCALNGRAGLLFGIVLHGLCYVLFFITAQIYLDERVEAAWRARAQALLLLATSGLGNLVGFLATGWWYQVCSGPGGLRWTLFWNGLAASVGVVMVYFLAVYRGKAAA